MHATRLFAIAVAITVAGAAVPLLAATPASAAPPPPVVFAPPVPVGGEAATDVVGDFNNDGALDLFGSTVFEAQYSLTRGDGHGRFAAPEVFDTDIGVSGLEAADVNADGWLDVVETGYELPRRKELWVIATWLNDGAGNLTPPTAARRTALAAEARLQLLDVDADGTLDAVAGSFNGDLYWLHGDGSGGFADPVLFASEGLPRLDDLIGADLDDDGHFDLVVLTSVKSGLRGQQVRIYYGNGSGFEPAVLVDLDQPYAVAVGDLTGDGILDLVAAVAYSSELVTVPGNDTRGFGPPVRTPLSGDPFSLLLADVNLDGRLDVVSGQLNGLPVPTLVYRGLGDGSVAREQALRPSSFLAQNVGDFTNDGRPDLVGTTGSPTLLVNLTGVVTGVAVQSVTVSESDGVARFTVARTGDLSGATRVGVTVVSGTATLGSDFTAPSRAEVRFFPGQHVQTLAVPLIDDSVPEPTEAFTVALSDVQGATVLRRTATATVLDDD